MGFATFVKKNLSLCHKAFKDGNSHGNWKSDDGRKLVKKARKLIGYKDSTYSGDIFYRIGREYFKMIEYKQIKPA
jgi:hypothetical protein